MNIFEKLMKIQSELKAPKNQYNSFGKYNYRSCEDILEGLKPHLLEVKAAVIVTDEIVLIGDRYYVKATADIMDTEKPEDMLSASAYAREDETKKGMDLAQVTGSVSSYARKYALNGLFCIDDTKDSDGIDKHGNEEKEPKKWVMSQTQQNKITVLAQKKDVSLKVKGQDWTSKKSSVEWVEADYMKVLAELMKLEDKK